MTDIEPGRERQATDDANEAARNTEATPPDAATFGVLGEGHHDPLPGDADEAVPASTPHREDPASPDAE